MLALNSKYLKNVDGLMIQSRKTNLFLARCGIFYISDIIGENKESLSHNELIDPYNINFSFLEYISVRMAISFDWRKIIREKQQYDINRYTLTILM